MGEHISIIPTGVETSTQAVQAITKRGDNRNMEAFLDLVTHADSLMHIEHDTARLYEVREGVAKKLIEDFSLPGDVATELARNEFGVTAKNIKLGKPYRVLAAEALVHDYSVAEQRNVNTGKGVWCMSEVSHGQDTYYGVVIQKPGNEWSGYIYKAAGTDPKDKVTFEKYRLALQQGLTPEQMGDFLAQQSSNSTVWQYVPVLR